MLYSTRVSSTSVHCICTYDGYDYVTLLWPLLPILKLQFYISCRHRNTTTNNHKFFLTWTSKFLVRSRLLVYFHSACNISPFTIRSFFDIASHSFLPLPAIASFRFSFSFCLHNLNYFATFNSRRFEFESIPASLRWNYNPNSAVLIRHQIRTRAVNTRLLISLRCTRS